MVFSALIGRYVYVDRHMLVASAGASAVAALLALVLAASGVIAAEPHKTIGPNACAECHKEETEAWKLTHHFKTFQDMPRKKEANEIAAKMKVRRIKSESLCLNCHFTVVTKDDKTEPVAGISCESCHGNGADFVKIHSEFSGKTEKTESKAEAAERWKKADAAGMIRPRAIYQLAKNCYGCHVVPEEALVNVGGHPAGSPFELVSWSQGEVRHNTWYSKGKDNHPDSAERNRILYVVGVAVELETAMRAIGKATARKLYAFEMAQRAARARDKLAAAAKAAPGVPELAAIVQLSHSTGLKLNNDRALSSAADGIEKQILTLTEKYDGSTLAAIDSLIPGPNQFKGKPRLK
jgi:Cytochrome c554 and c-prime